MKKGILLILILTTNLTFGQLPNKISKEEKVYGLSKFWQEVNYNFVYFSKVDKTEWDKLYLKLIGEVQETKNDYNFDDIDSLLDDEDFRRAIDSLNDPTGEYNLYK